MQKRRFNYFSFTHFRYLGKLYEPFEGLSDTIMADGLNVKNLIRWYERHLRKNWDWLLQEVPRRTDLRIYEAVYPFTLYMYLGNAARFNAVEPFPRAEMAH